MSKYQAHEFSLKQYVTDSSRISLKILIFWDATMLLQTSIYDAAEGHTQYGTTKRRKLLPKRYGVTFYIFLTLRSSSWDTSTYRFNCNCILSYIIQSKSV
jgi:hypothetical protein